MSSTLKLATEVAALLDSDPILAAQVKKELGASRFLELFQTSAQTELPEGEAGELIQALLEKKVPLSEVIKLYRTQQILSN